LIYALIAFELEQYTDPNDLAFLTSVLDLTAFGQRHKKLSETLCGLIEEFGLISFVPFAIEEKECLAYLLQEIDKANGYVFGSLTAGNENIMDVCMTSAGSDKYIDRINKRHVLREEPEEDSE